MSPIQQGALILLAAGRGTRFGSDKRQHALATGSSLLATTLMLYQRYYKQIVVVLRPGDEALAQSLTVTQIVYAQDAAKGMGHSLASGAGHLLALAPTSTTVTVALADMPYVQPNTLQQLQKCSAKLTAPFILQPTYQGKSGNPVVFSSDYLGAFTKLTGDQGARAIIRSQPQAVHLLAVDDPGIHHDIDQPQDILT